jgi:hypothetical protein
MNLNTERVRALNEELRRNLPNGHAVMTAGIAALGPEAVARIVKTIAVYDDFCHANDPYGEHDFGSFEADGQRLRHDKWTDANADSYKAAQGTQGWVPWSDYQNASQAIADAKARGAWVVVAEQITDSVRPEQLVPKFPACLVLGGERSGVSPEAIAVADAAVAIPMLGMANSLVALS